MNHSPKTARVIDVHAHAVLSETMGAAGKYGPEIGATPQGQPWFRVGSYRLDGVRYVGSPFMDPELRLKRMDEAGIDYQVLSPNPLTYFHFIPSTDAIRYCRTHNDAMAQVVAPRSGRLGALAALPMQDVAAACEELRRAATELGMLGAQIGTDMPHRLDDPKMDALYETCVALNVPLFIHPGPAGIDGPPGDPSLKQFDLDVVVGFAAQEVLAICTLLYSGVLDRHPQLDLCLSHGGGAMGYLFGRMKRAVKKRPWVPEALKPEGALEERLQRIWFDNHLNHDPSLDMLKSLIGDDRLVYGTNFAGWDAPDVGDGHAPEPKLADNARRLLRLIQ
jgi:aminocarboxymuconate-semialdehyde decarboxylase